MAEAKGRSRSARHQFVGCLLGGAVGDAVGALVEFDALATIRRRFGPRGLTGKEDDAPLCITDDTQMTLFTAEGLLRSDNRWRGGQDADRPTILHRAYLRWFETQGSRAPGLGDLDRESWLLSQPGLRQRRAPGNTCLTALASGRAGTVTDPPPPPPVFTRVPPSARPRPDAPINDSKGCGGVMRVAPVGLAMDRAFDAACEAAAITHGHPGGYLPAGVFASVIARCRKGHRLATAITRAITELREYPRHKETLDAIRRATALADERPRPTPEAVERLGAGWVGEEALAIALYCALTAKTFAGGIRAAVNHSGDSDSTGAMTGNLLGVMWGVEAIPAAWLARLELREVIETVADDLYRHFGSQARRAFSDTDRYPPW